MSSTQQHIVLTVDNKVVYDSSSPATTTPAPPAATEIDVKNLNKVDTPEKNKEYYVVTYGVTTPNVFSKPEKRIFISKREFPSGPNETTYEYTVADTTGKNYTYSDWGSGGTQVLFWEIPAGGKRRNNRRKSAKKGGRSRRMRRMRRSNNRKSSRRF